MDVCCCALTQVWLKGISRSLQDSEGTFQVAAAAASQWRECVLYVWDSSVSYNVKFIFAFMDRRKSEYCALLLFIYLKWTIYYSQESFMQHLVFVRIFFNERITHLKWTFYEISKKNFYHNIFQFAFFFVLVYKFPSTAVWVTASLVCRKSSPWCSWGCCQLVSIWLS